MAVRSSTTLTGAISALVEKQNQIVRPALITELRADGSVYCRINGEVKQVVTTTDQALEAGMPVQLVKGTRKNVLLGSS